VNQILGRSLSAAVIFLTAILLIAADAPKHKSTPLVIQGDTLIVVKTLPCKVVAPAGATLYDWSYPDNVKAFAEDNVLTVTFAQKGSFVVRVRMTTIDFDKKAVTRITGEIEVNYGGVQPGPGPGPGPDPPKPDPSPIPEAGLRVLIVEDAKNRNKLPPAQFAIIFDKGLRDYLNSKCAQDGKVKAWRIWPDGVDATAESKTWQDAMKRDRKSLPWIIVSNHPHGGYEGPLPADVDQTLALVKKYAEGGK